MPGDGGHSRVIRLLPFAAAGLCRSLVQLQVLVGRMRSVLVGRVAALLCCTSMARPSKMVSRVTLASAPFPELPGGEGQQSSSSGHGARRSRPN
jgi:hypothetical protein